MSGNPAPEKVAALAAALPAIMERARVAIQRPTPGVSPAERVAWFDGARWAVDQVLAWIETNAAGYDVARIEEGERLRAALAAMSEKWGPHSGACCEFDDAGHMTVTQESCKCGPIEREARAALAASDEAVRP